MGEGRPDQTGELICATPECVRLWTVPALRLCTPCYQRQRAGQPLTDPRRGQPSGYGRYGIIERGETWIMCHECGDLVVSVPHHIRPTHHMTIRAYRAKHGLPQGASLASVGLERGQRARASQPDRAAAQPRGSGGRFVTANHSPDRQAVRHPV